MTKEEAITRLKGLYGNGYTEQEQALDMAIRALKNEQTGGDLISRQDAIDIVVFECGEWIGLAKEISKQLRQLPSAEKTAEEQTDGDLISRQAVSKYVRKMITNRTYPEERQVLEDFIEWLDNLPSAEKTAEWVAYTEECGWLYQCSNCCWSYEEETKFCPHCGAIMNGVE